MMTTTWEPRVYEIALAAKAESGVVLRLMRQLGYAVKSPSTRTRLEACEYEALVRMAARRQTLHEVDRIRRHTASLRLIATRD